MTIQVEDIRVGNNYMMDDGRVLKVESKWTAEDGHERLAFSVVRGEIVGPSDTSLRDFVAKALRII